MRNRQNIGYRQHDGHQLAFNPTNEVGEPSDHPANFTKRMAQRYCVALSEAAGANYSSTSESGILKY
jgi:hypothetical protein